jgi:hypothetical protein
MGTSCDRWIALSDREALGTPLSPSELAFFRAHLGICVECASESALYAALPRVVDPAASAPRVRPAAPARPARGRDRGLEWAAAAALAAAAVLFFLAPDARVVPRQAISKETETDGRATLSFAADVPLVDGRPTVVGETIGAGARVVAGGDLCLRIEPAIRACLARGGEMVVADLGPHTRLGLERGRLVASLAHRAPGSAFTIATSEGTVTAVGTVFAVEASRGARPSARVLEGRVRVVAGGETFLDAGESLTLGDPAAHPTAPADRAADEALLASAALWDGGPGATLEIATDPPGADVEVDGARLGPSPIALVVRPGMHGLGAAARGRSAVAERLVLGEGERATRAYLLRPIRASAPRPAPPPSAAEPSESPGDLLRSARAHRARGEFREAADAYADLQARFCASPEAHASLVSLGELQLSALHDPVGALRSFEAYLAVPAGLALEARHGRIQALGALGRAVAERVAIEEFLRDYPTSVQARSLRARLDP